MPACHQKVCGFGGCPWRIAPSLGITRQESTLSPREQTSWLCGWKAHKFMLPAGGKGAGGDAHLHPRCILHTERLQQTLAEERLRHRRCKHGLSVTDFLSLFWSDF